jgi:hypothetical protein
MYPALLMGPLFLVLIASLHQVAAVEKKVFSQIALAFATMAATALVINYYIQLTVVQASLLKGEGAELSLLSQYNPHGIFIALEDVGYLMMGLAFLVVAPIFNPREKLALTLRLLFTISGALVVGALSFLALRYGSDLEYRFEVASLLVDWLTLIIGGVLVAFFLKRTGQTG